MKFIYKGTCECGGELIFLKFLATGEAEFDPAECSSCKKAALLLDPLSVSVTSERLLYRSKVELENGETLAFRSSSQPLRSNLI
jgi:hypothetical protein